MKFSRTINSWFGSRPWRRIWWCLPALTFVVAWVIFALTLLFTGSAALHRQYVAVAKRSLAARDYKTLRVASQRLLLSWPSESRMENQFQLSMALFGLGQTGEGTALLALAAPREQPGYAPAHMFVARYLLSRTNLTARMAQDAVTQLNHVLELEPESEEATEMLGRLYFRIGDWENAKAPLEAVVGRRPEVAFMLAVMAKKAGDEVHMRHWAEIVSDYYQDRVGKSSADDPSDRLNWAQSLTFQDNYEEAAQVLEDGLKNSNDPRYASTLAEVYAYWAAETVRAKPNDLATRFELIQKGLQYDHKNIRLLDLLLSLSHLEGQEGRDAEATFTKMLAAGDSSAMLHLLLANDAAQRGDQEQAEKHYSLAFSLAPDLPVVANNMALLLVLTKKPDLPRALSIIQPLVERYPNQPDFRNTRGQIYVKLGRWDEAVKDLEYALPLVLDKTATHSALAVAYRNLGMTNLADEHELLASHPLAAHPADQNQSK